MDTNSVALASIALVGSILALVVKPLFNLLDANTKALNAVVDGSTKVADEIKQGNKEAKQRNGHLGDQNIQITKIVKEISENLPTQRVENQVVEHQHVKETT